jgi:cell division protein FtsQ
MLKTLLVAGLFAGIITAVWYFDPQEKLQQFAHRPIKQVQIEGAFQFISSESLQRQIELYVKDSFLELELSDLKQQLEQNPWIDSVAIARVWPDKLIVRVVEQQPIAQWGKKGFLNMRGDIVEVEKTTKIQALPLLQGDDRYAQEIMGQYLRIGKLFAQQNLVLAAMELDDTRAWTLTLQSGIRIKLGRERLWEKLQYLLTAKSGELGKDFHNIQLVDMRYPSGFAVTWKSADANHYVAGG